MKNNIRILSLAAVIALLCTNCTKKNIISSPTNILRKNRVIAIIPIKVAVTVDDSKSFKFISKMSSLTKSNIMKKLNIGTAANFLIQKDKGKVVKFQDYLSEIISKNFTKKRYAPLDRSAIIEAVKKARYSRIKGIDQKRALKIGKLARAESIFLGNLHVKVKRSILTDDAELIFSGKLVSIADGTTILSGMEAVETYSINPTVIRKLIEAWFDGVKKIR